MSYCTRFLTITQMPLPKSSVLIDLQGLTILGRIGILHQDNEFLSSRKIGIRGSGDPVAIVQLETVIKWHRRGLKARAMCHPQGL